MTSTTSRLVWQQRLYNSMQGTSTDEQYVMAPETREREGEFDGRHLRRTKAAQRLAGRASSDCTSALKTHGVGTSTKVLVDLSCVLWSSEKNSVATLWCSESELVEGEALSTSSFDTLAGGAGESECSDAQLLLEVDESDIVGDGSNENNGVLGGVGLAVSNFSADSADADGSAVGSALIQTAQNNPVKFAVRSSGEEAVELDLQAKYQNLGINSVLTRERKLSSKRRYGSLLFGSDLFPFFTWWWTELREERSSMYGSSRHVLTESSRDEAALPSI